MFTPTTARHGINSGDLKCAVFASSEISAVWGELSAMLVPCVQNSNGILSLEMLERWLLHEQAVAFATIRDNRIIAVVVVMPVFYSTYSVARVVAFAGKGAKDCMNFLPALETWAFTHGCVEIEGWCLPPVARLMRKLGWKQEHVRMTLDLRRKLQ